MPEEKKKKKYSLRIILGILACLFMIVYMIYQVSSYFFSSSISLYQVVKGSSASSYESQYTALILREETVITSSKSGYINFFVGDSTPISVDEETYLIDESGTLYEELSEMASDVAIFNEEELLEIKNTICDFDTTFSEDEYSDVYSFKYKLESQLLDIIYSSAFDSLSIDLAEYDVMTSEISGIMAHWTDGFEDIDADNMEASYFRQSNYSKNMITSNEYVEAGDAVYKVVTSEEWQLVIQIDDADAFEDVDSIEIEFLKDGITATCDFYMYTSAGFTYGVLSLDKYMYRYVSDRYVQISLTDSSVEEGYMIPVSSVSTEQFYIIPAEYLTTGGNSSSYGFLVQTTDQSGTSVQFVVPDIVKTTDEYVYVSSEFFDEGDIIVQTDTNETYTIRIKENLEGVYVSENGSYNFACVEITGTNGDYYIVDPDSSSINLYDNIVYDAQKITD